MLTDVPQIVTDTSFVQKVQPPPPEGMRPAVGVLTIPGDRDTSQFRGAAVFDPSMLDNQPVPACKGARPTPLRCAAQVSRERWSSTSSSMPTAMSKMRLPSKCRSANLNPQPCKLYLNGNSNPDAKAAGTSTRTCRCPSSSPLTRINPSRDCLILYLPPFSSSPGENCADARTRTCGVHVGSVLRPDTTATAATATSEPERKGQR